MLIEIDDSEDKISLSKIIGSFKRYISKIVKDTELNEIMKYINENPLKWKFDEYYK